MHLYRGKDEPSEKPTVTLAARRTKQIATEFCNVTSIHGFRQLLGDNKLAVERLWWLTLFIASLLCCLNFIYSIYEKWEREPIIVTFHQQSSSIYTIPFPAVTICPETKVKSSELNFTKTFELVRSGKLNESMDEERVRKVLALLQLCDYDLYDRHETPSHDNDMLKLLRKMAIPSFEVFETCTWKGNAYFCLDLFKTTLTEKGFCYTFNSLANNDLMRTEELDENYGFNSETRPSDWTLDNGYLPGIGHKAFPRRVVSGGYHGGLGTTLLVNKSDMDYLCGDSFQGFKVILHMPNEYPQLTHQFFRIPPNQELIVTVTPRVMATDRKVQLYNPNKRNCYYSHERYLRFFKIYTQKNCEVECLTNYTLKLCGCVRFSMPRPRYAPLCSLRDSPCYQKAFSTVLQLEGKVRDGPEELMPEYCNCLPSCNSIDYSTQVSQADWNWRNGEFFGHYQRLSTNEGIHQSKMIIYFKEAQFIPLKRSELYGVSDLIANCGGLMGLFMGVSIMSLVELAYYCTFRPIALWRLSKRAKDPAKSRCTCGEKVDEYEFDEKHY